jgi:hypothetical protein
LDFNSTPPIGTFGMGGGGFQLADANNREEKKIEQNVTKETKKNRGSDYEKNYDFE